LRREEQIATARADLELREAEITSSPRGRAATMQRAQSAKAARAHDADVVPDGEWQEVRARDFGSRDERERDEPTVVAAVARVAGQAGFTEPGLSEPPRSAPAPQHNERAMRSAGPPPLRARTASAPIAQRVTSAPPLKKSEPPPPLHRASRSPVAPPLKKSEPPPVAAGRTVRPSEAPARSSSPSVALDPARVRRSVPPASGDLAAVDLQAVHDALRLPSRRIEALDEIARRRDPSSIGSVFGLSEDLSDEQLAAAIACVAGFGERACAALIAGLSASKPEVRQACALALGKLKRRRGLAPLLEQLESEPTAAWNEIARALGDYGLAALRALSRGLRASQRRERLMVALAHLAHHGCAEDLESLEKDPDTVLALAAKQALARAPRLEWEDKAVRGGGNLAEASSEARFSQLVYAALG
jgi:hypothetical protein